jgi:fatty-acyl-CoA synthase
VFEGDLLAERARITPDREAVLFVPTGERFTYAQLDARADAAAAMLIDRGIQPGDRFGIHGPNSVDYIDFFFGAGRIGAIIVPLSTRATPHELDAIKADCAMKFVVETGSVSLESKGGSRLPHSRQNPDDIHCLLYTSGTTGKPKGVMIPRRQLWWNGYNTVVNWGLREDDVSPLYTPMYHAGGLAAFLIPIFTIGGRIVLHDKFDTTEVWNTIERERCTVVLGVPTIWKMLMDAPEFATANLDHVRWFISGGAPLPAYIIEAYAKRGITMRQGFGMTEVGVNCFTMTSEDARRKAGSIGRPLMFTSVKIAGEKVIGDVGELLIRGPHVSSGYWNNEEATRATYDAGGWLHTGDLGRRDEDGFFYIAGRAKDMFITGGVNVYPAEIEAELVSHPLVADAAVVPVSDETWGEVAVAFVVSRAKQEDLERYLAERLARYKLPKRYIFIDTLPRTPYGKVEKGKLRDQLS